MSPAKHIKPTKKQKQKKDPIENEKKIKRKRHTTCIE